MNSESTGADHLARRTSESQNQIEESPPNKKPKLSAEPAANAPRRAAQACLRCRKQKLRCLGGWPCARCNKANKECSFGGPGQYPITSGDGDPEGATARLQHLESSVADLLAGLSRSGEKSREREGGWAARHPSTTILPQVPRGSAQFGVPQASSTSYWSSPSDSRAGAVAVDAHWPRAGREAVNEEKGKEVAAEERLATATRETFEPPFKALVYQPSVWENRERSRLNSPSRDERPLLLAQRPRIAGDDPVGMGIVGPDTATGLFTFYVTHCHPFLPIVDPQIVDSPAAAQRSSALLSAVMAIAARFHTRYHARPAAPPPQIRVDLDVPARLAELAEHHLAQTLLRKQHTLADVQAILLLAAWGLQSGGKGPDAWVLTGHTARVARRLGFHKLIRQFVDSASSGADAGTQDAKFQRIAPQWRTCLAWYSFDSFLSLGFGRPQSTQFEIVHESAFLEARLKQTIPRPGSVDCAAFYGDVYLAGQAELSHIARRLVRWTEDQSTEEQGEQAMSLLEDLNSKLDDWCKKWIWSGSRYSLYLGSAARIARLQAEHLRLSINSIALRIANLPDVKDDLTIGYLRKALNAATSTIQTHSESSQTDLFLSFTTDYLTITLAQAAVFLIRLTRSPAQIQSVVSLDPLVVAHYLIMSIDLLQHGDISETRLSSYLAKTVREIARAASIDLGPDLADSSRDTTTQAVPDVAQVVGRERVGEEIADTSTSMSAGNMFDAEAFWAGNDQFDLGYFLGLSEDMPAVISALETSGVGGESTVLLESFANNWDTSFGMHGSA